MAYDIRKVDVWVGEMEDSPGQLAERLESLTAAGANLEFIIARRAWNHPTKSVLFVAPLRGAAQAAAARGKAMEKALGMHAIRIEGPDRAGLAARICRSLSDAGLNIRGWSGASLGKRSVMYAAFATNTEAVRAMRVVRGAVARR